MSKELEALKRIKSHYNDRVCIDILEDFDLIETALKRLESYEFMFRSCELSMSKEKEALQRTDSFRLGCDEFFNKSGYNFNDYHKDMEILREALNTLQTLRLFYREDTDKKLKALEIIIDKQVDIRIFLSSAILGNHEEPDAYNFTVSDVKRYLTQEEFNLLKEVLL